MKEGKGRYTGESVSSPRVLLSSHAWQASFHGQLGQAGQLRVESKPVTSY